MKNAVMIKIPGVPPVASIRRLFHDGWQVTTF